MYTFAYFGLPGGSELIIILFIVLIFFGKRLPNAMYSVGKSITEFKKGASEGAPDSMLEDDQEQSENKSE